MLEILVLRSKDCGNRVRTRSKTNVNSEDIQKAKEILSFRIDKKSELVRESQQDNLMLSEILKFYDEIPENLIHLSTKNFESFSENQNLARSESFIETDPGDIIAWMVYFLQRPNLFNDDFSSIPGIETILSFESITNHEKYKHAIKYFFGQ